MIKNSPIVESTAELTAVCGTKKGLEFISREIAQFLTNPVFEGILIDRKLFLYRSDSLDLTNSRVVSERFRTAVLPSQPKGHLPTLLKSDLTTACLSPLE